ncbi:MurR/RpiR family transcriptional regulator [Paenibacillus flagellatus]|uniref:RpiR family transcriptional regulator n=1 Tax=Paenibacillus flagellatus TaxID=2211139 RepID=A0A2V5KW52_9BACL|nr:MurR/RpiR family transcriptional regulator [Paenibacillus flagellatus]PYI53876.1 RpiR family transcriptional regulator [Paenibacillus flagellatus]
MNGGLIRIREMLQHITPSERIIADYILNHPEDMAHMSVADLAERSGGSQAAIIRLCKSLGFKGYPELKMKVVGDLQAQETYEYREFSPNDSIATIVQNVSHNNMQSIRDTMKILDLGHLQRAVEALSRANRIFFYGTGASNLIAQDAQQKFLRINKASFTFTDPTVQLTAAVTIQADDVAVGISYSGETKPVIQSLLYANEAGATTISITKYGHTTLSGVAGIPLFTASTENEIRSGAMTSRITQLNLIDILYLSVASLNYEKSVEYLERSRKVLKDLAKLSSKKQ